MKSHFILFCFLLNLLRSFWNRHMIQWFSCCCCFFRCISNVQMFTTKKKFDCTHKTRHFFLSFDFVYDFFVCSLSLSAERKKAAAHHYDIICVMILLFMAPHFATLYLIHQIHFLLLFLIRPHTLVLGKTFFLFSFHVYLSVFRALDKIKNTHEWNVHEHECNEFFLLTKFFLFLSSSFVIF